MLPPLKIKKFAVIDPGGFDGAMYVCQTNSRLWAWVVWRIFCRGKGGIVELNLQMAGVNAVLDNKPIHEDPSKKLASEVEASRMKPRSLGTCTIYAMCDDLAQCEVDARLKNNGSHVNSLHNQVGVALKESIVWNELSVGPETLGPGLHLITQRRDGDHSPELLMQYRRSIADVPDFVVHYTEQMEEDCNEGLHDLHQRTWNLLRFLNKQIPAFSFDLDQGVFVPVVKGKELAPAKTWMFAWD